MKLKTKELIRHFGGITKLKADLDAAGAMPISMGGIAKWGERGSISYERWTELVRLAKSQGTKLKMADWTA